MSADVDWSALIEEATKARTRAYSPYSGFSVGAAITDASGKVFSGANVENASYGATICAERVALTAAISSGAGAPTALVIVTGAEEPTPPCGICRQVIAEFSPKCVIRAYAQDGTYEQWRLDELLPSSFRSSHFGGDSEEGV